MTLLELQQYIIDNITGKNSTSTRILNTIFTGIASIVPTDTERSNWNGKLNSSDIIDGTTDKIKSDLISVDSTYFEISSDGQLKLSTTILALINSSTGTTINQAPTGTATLVGTAQVGQVLTGSHTYSDTESDPQGLTIKQLYRADDNNGTNKVAITGATVTGIGNLTYTISTDDLGKYLVLGALLKATSGTLSATEIYSTYTAIVIAAPNITPDAPTNGIVDDTGDTFSFTLVPEIPLNGNYEKTLDGGTTITDLGSSPLTIGNIAKDAGQVGIRVKAASGRNPSSWLFNTTPFTITNAGPATYRLTVNVSGITDTLEFEDGSGNSITGNYIDVPNGKVVSGLTPTNTGYTFAPTVAPDTIMDSDKTVSFIATAVVITPDPPAASNGLVQGNIRIAPSNMIIQPDGIHYDSIQPAPGDEYDSNLKMVGDGVFGYTFSGNGTYQPDVYIAESGGPNSVGYGFYFGDSNNMFTAETKSGGNFVETQIEAPVEGVFYGISKRGSNAVLVKSVDFVNYIVLHDFALTSVSDTIQQFQFNTSIVSNYQGSGITTV